MFAQDFGCFHYDIDWDPQATEWDFRGLNDLTAEPNNLAPSEDFWKKFEEMPDFPPDLNEDLDSLFGVDTGEMDLSSVIMNHDCMWSGTCLNKDHKPENKPPPPPPPVSLMTDSNPSSPVLSTTNDEPSMPAPKTPPKIVRKRPTGVHTFGARTTATVKREEPPRPDTPPSLSESEEDELSTKQRSNNETPLSTMQHSTTAHIRRTIQTSAFDHNYDKSVRPEDYGLQTPSDSEEEPNQSSASEEEEEDEEEEEIDVVSLSRDTLPTNPTREIRSQLQRKVASAISTNSLLNAKRAVSRRLKQTKKAKRKRTSSDEDEADDYDDIVVDNTRITAAVSSACSSSSYYLPAVNNHNHHSIGHNVHVTGHHQIGASSTTTATSVGRRNWRKNAKKGRFSDSEPDSERRSIHNNMERMRRIDLRNAFDDLKTLLPSLAEAQRAPKVTILKDATSYLHELRQKEKTLAQHVSKLRSHQEELRSTLSRLRKNLAAIR